MKETWLYYDFLRRWWLLLILGPGLGALAGLGYFLQQDRPPEFKATASFSIPAEEHRFNVVSDVASTERAAVESLVTLANTFEQWTGRRFGIRVVQMERRYEAVWWRPTALGGVIGALLAVAVSLMWQDTRAYVRHRQQME